MNGKGSLNVISTISKRLEENLDSDSFVCLFVSYDKENDVSPEFFGNIREEEVSKLLRSLADMTLYKGPASKKNDERVIN